jgi:hypothetical protein
MVKTFAHSFLERSKNPSLPNLLEQLGRFDSQLQSEFQAFLDEDDERLSRDLAFLVDRRHKIAHGLNEGINPARALALTESAKDVADWFVLRLNPTRS